MFLFPKIEDTATSLGQESSEILDIFTNTVDSLRNVNARITARKKFHDDEAARHQSESQTLTTQAATNEKVIEKINHFFN